MKNVKFLAMLAFVAAGLFTTTSCSDNEEFSGMSITANAKMFYELRANSDVPATFTYGGETKTGKEVVFETQVKQGTMTVTADGYLPQEAEINFSEVTTVNNVDIKMVKESTINVAQSQAKGNVISNDSENQGVIGLQSLLSVSDDVSITGNTSDPFSLVVFEPTKKLVDVSNQKEGEVVTVPLVGVRCEPDGAQFDKPVSVSLNLEDAADFDLTCPTAFEGTSVKANAKGVTAQVGHFSNVFIAANATRIKVVDKSTTTSTRLKVKAGENVYKYNEYTGYKATYKANSVEDRFLKSQYGSYASLSRQTKFNASAAGYATIETTQYMYDVTWRSGKVTIRATVYGSLLATATVNGQKTTLFHSGGSN